MNRTTPSLTLSDKVQGVYLLSGDLVYSTVPDFVKEGDSLLDLSLNQIVIDCSAVKRLDSAGLSLFLEWKRQCQAANKQVSFTALPDQATSMLETFMLKDLLSQ